MIQSFRVVDVRSNSERTVRSVSADAAAVEVLRLTVVRSGSPKNLVARVYWQNTGAAMNMVRFYCKAADGAPA